MTDEDLQRCAVAARRVLTYLWTVPASPVIRFALDAVAATAEADPVQADAVLRPGIEPDRLSTSGWNYIHWLCDLVPVLIRTVPALVEDLYLAVLPFNEDSNEPTHLLASAIMPLSSTRRQDFEMGKYDLVRHFPRVLDVAPDVAISIITRLSESHATGDAKWAATVGAHSIEVTPDDSARWDSRTFANEHGLVDLLNSFEEHLAAQGDEDTLNELLDKMMARSQPAALWRRVLAAAARNEALANRFMPLDDAIRAWAAHDTVAPLGALVASHFASRPEDERARVEAAVLVLDPGEQNDAIEWYAADRLYRRLLHALEPAAVASERVADAQQASGPPSDEGFGMASPRPFDNEWEQYGLRIQSDEDKTVWDLAKPLREFVDAHLNETPENEAAHTSAEVVRQLLEAPERSRASEGVRAFADSTIARAAEIWTRRGSDHDPDVLKYAKALLLDFRAHELPLHRDDQDDRRLTLIPQGPRSDVARGLLQLGRFDQYFDQDIMSTVRELATDDVPWIRYEIARQLPNLRQVAPDEMWSLLHQIAERDPHDGVLRGVALSAWLLRIDVDRAVQLLDVVAQHSRPQGNRESAGAACAEAAGLLWILEGHEGAKTVLSRFTAATDSDEPVAGLLHEVRSAGAFTSEDNEVRRRAFDLCEELAEAGFALLGDLESVAAEDEERVAQARRGAKLLDSISSQLYFASGAFEARRDNAHAQPSEAEVRFGEEAAGLVARLGGAPLPPITHHLVELLEHLIDASPERTLLAVRSIVVGGGKRGGYQLDKMAIDLVVRIVQRILADHRGVLQRAESLTALRELLDVFVDAGWPEAHRLAYGLEHIFR
jgi:hypothetical protein